MKFGRVLLDIVGSILAAAASFPYFMFSLGRAWEGRTWVDLMSWFTISSLIVGAIVVPLTILLRPTHLWLFPLLLCTTTLAFAFASMESAAGLTWLAVGVATCGIGWLWSLASRWLTTRLAHPNSTAESDPRKAGAGGSP